MYCTNCGGYLIERKSNYGRFYGCSNYPDCTKIVDISDIDEYVSSELYKEVEKKRKQQEKRIEEEFKNYCPNYCRNGDCKSDKSRPGIYGFKCTGNYDGDFSGCNRQDKDGR